MERQLFTALITAVLLVLSVGLSWWVWLDRPNRVIPGPEDLVELRGYATAPQVRNRPSSVWFRFEASSKLPESPAKLPELQVRVREPAVIEAAIKNGPVPVVVLAVKSELNRGPREPPPTVLQFQANGHTLVPLAMGQELRAEQAAAARLSAWVAMAGAVISLAALVVHWVTRLRS